ncbi:64bfa33a-bc4b-49e5-b6d7-426b77a88412 [Sclerotinia trifoliorum]|uniref:Transcription factor SWI6 n=1 Tax=Sclerotinia trifoliorum TaxID=28548 RepID=A0A8H2W0S3_9HELO|nr:64bfa33a-bc4b-49e5-b6d7-426b77a88412 [Sclerotinia trifoliorum]
MAATTIAPNSQPLATTSDSKRNQLPPNTYSTSNSAYGGGQDSARFHREMSLGMSQGSQSGGMMMQPGGAFRQYESPNTMNRRDIAPQIYSAVYSGVDVYEMEVNCIAVMRRRKDSWLNATQILKVAGIEKGKRTKVLEKEILIGDHEKVQGGYGKYQGTWIRFERGVEFCKQYGVEELLRPLLSYDMGQDGGIAGQGGIDTPTKEQAMAAQRKRLYNSGAENRNNGQSGTFFKNISNQASLAVAAISKARFDSPVPRNRNGSARPPTFSRQSSQQQPNSQETAFPGNSQQSMQSFVSNEGLTNGDSAYATQSQFQFSHTGREDGDFQEPPRKRRRESPEPPNDSQQSMNGGHYNMSMREPSPTEPSDSFFYRQEPKLSQGEEAPMPLPPLPENHHHGKKSLTLLSLFHNENSYLGTNEHNDQEAFRTMSGVELDIPIDKSANTAVHWAATLARLPVLQKLIQSGASIYRVNLRGETALMRACCVANNLDQGSFPDLLELLGNTIGFQDNRGRTVLHHIAVTSAVKGRSPASKYYLESLLEFVVRKGRSFNGQSQNTEPSNPHAMDIGRFMSEMVNAQDNSGDTALNIAARVGNKSIISQLMEVGADPEIQNNSKLRPSDFIGGLTNPGDRLGVASPDKRGNKATRETSGEIIDSINATLQSTLQDFGKEVEAKQAQIDSIHAKLREASASLGEERRAMEAKQERNRQREERDLKIANLTRAAEEESAKLLQLQQQFNQPISDLDLEMHLGDADKSLAIPPIPADINITPTRNSNVEYDHAQRQLLLQQLPSMHILQARINAYKAINDSLERSVQELKSKDTGRIAKYKKIISLCTGVDISKVDGVIEGLARAVESESDVDLNRVREFLTRVEGV